VKNIISISFLKHRINFSTQKIATYLRKASDLNPEWDQKKLIPALAKYNIQAVAAVWDDASIKWSQIWLFGLEIPGTILKEQHLSFETDQIKN
jgi:hypothetical protein